MKLKIVLISIVLALLIVLGVFLGVNWNVVKANLKGENLYSQVDLDRLHKDIEEEYTIIIAEYSKNLENSKNEFSLLEAKFKNTEKLLEDEKVSNSENKEKIEELQNNLSQLQAELSSVQEQLVEANNALKVLTAQLQDQTTTKQNLANLRVLYNALQDNYDSLLDKYNELQDSVYMLTQDYSIYYQEGFIDGMNAKTYEFSFSEEQLSQIKTVFRNPAVGGKMIKIVQILKVNSLLRIVTECQNGKDEKYYYFLEIPIEKDQEITAEYVTYLANRDVLITFPADKLKAYSFQSLEYSNQEYYQENESLGTTYRIGSRKYTIDQMHIFTSRNIDSDKNIVTLTYSILVFDNEKPFEILDLKFSKDSSQDTSLNTMLVEALSQYIVEKE